MSGGCLFVPYGGQGEAKRPSVEDDIWVPFHCRSPVLEPTDEHGSLC